MDCTPSVLYVRLCLSLIQERKTRKSEIYEKVARIMSK